MKYKIELEIEKKIIEKETKEVSYAEYIGFKIKKMRLERKLSQEDLSKAIPFSRSNLSNLEKGRFNITLKTLEKICSYFKCKSSDILPF